MNALIIDIELITKTKMNSIWFNVENNKNNNRLNATEHLLHRIEDGIVWLVEVYFLLSINWLTLIGTEKQNRFYYRRACWCLCVYFFFSWCRHNQIHCGKRARLITLFFYYWNRISQTKTKTEMKRTKTRQYTRIPYGFEIHTQQGNKQKH